MTIHPTGETVNREWEGDKIKRSIRQNSSSLSNASVRRIKIEIGAKERRAKERREKERKSHERFSNGGHDEPTYSRYYYRTWINPINRKHHEGRIPCALQQQISQKTRSWRCHVERPSLATNCQMAT